ncbi:MAG: alpha/beta hydrolase, partial [Clostridia bacterium]|nr:alpha/beta hydrolase [Clostridia bacterium]
MSLFVTISKLNALPLRLGQYYLNKDAFDKKTDTYGTYEVSDLNYLYGDVPAGPYDPKAAAMGGDARWHLLDVYSPTPLDVENPEKLPVIVEIHGGGYLTNNKECNRPHGMYFASKGYKVVNINYTLQPEAEFDQELREINAAFDWIGANADKYGFDLDNVFLTGDSSGGHLSLLYTAVQTRPDLQEYFKVTAPAVKIKGTALTCPVGSFLDPDIVSTAFRNLAGRLYDTKGKMNISYQGFADETYPEVCIVTTDTDVPIHTNSEAVHKWLDFKGVAHQYKSFEGKTHKLAHVFNVLHPDWEESIEANQFILDFFEKRKTTP